MRVHLLVWVCFGGCTPVTAPETQEAPGPESTEGELPPDETGAAPEVSSWSGLWVFGDNACAIHSSGYAVCWGEAARVDPSTNPPGGIWSALAKIDGSGCGLRSDGSLVCWGCAPGDTACDAPPGSWERFFASDEGYCAAGSDGLLTCWGSRSLQRDVPAVPLVDVDLPCGVDAFGSPVCWALGEEASAALTLEGPFRAVRSAGDNCWCGITADDSLVCEQLRQDVPGEYEVLGLPTDPPTSVLDADVVNGAICAILPDQTLYCSTEQGDAREDVPSGQFSEVRAGGIAACAIDLEGQIACWGDPESALLSGIPVD